MARLEDLTKGALVRGILGDRVVKVVDIAWHGSSAVTLTFTDELTGKAAQELLDREDEARLTVEKTGRAWSMDADGDLFRLVSEARRISLAYLFDPFLAVQTSTLDPLPHQIDAVYDKMLPRQPLRFLLADDPGAGKTIMAGLFCKELMIRGDVERCLIVAPGSLVEQWQDELWQKFGLDFEILTKDMIEAARSGNPFAEQPLLIARLDQLSRNEDLQAKLAATDWDLVVVDEAHKMSAHYIGGEIRETKRYQLGQLAGSLARHLLLMTATPHTGNEEDFQLFLALLDADRFEGKPRDGLAHDRSVGPDAAAGQGGAARRSTASRCSPSGAPTRRSTRSRRRGPALQAGDGLRPRGDEPRRPAQGRRRGQPRRHRRIRAHHPAAPAGLLAGGDLPVAAPSAASAWRSDSREEQIRRRGARAGGLEGPAADFRGFDDDFDLDDLPEGELEELEEQLVDQASAARTIAELEHEIATLADLEELARQLRDSGTDRKWDELSRLAPGHARRCSTRTAAGAS